MKKALIAMSGGVDSSVAALLTQKSGYECVGCTMKLYNNEDICTSNTRTCCSLDDVEDARSVAYNLGMPYYVFNLSDDFRKKVMERFAQSYEAGVTPNPCIDCNRYLKFGKLYERADILGCDYIVTGHYARIGYDGTRFFLKKALDETKDQSYVLYFMTQEQLARTLFPLGDLRKTEIRQIAAKNGFSNAEKPDSQDICFVPDGDYVAFLENYTSKEFKSGVFLSTSGEVLGKHKGIVRYTVGQRKGLGLSLSEPAYVCRIDAESNSVIIGNDHDLFKTEAYAEDFNWISGIILGTEIRCKVKVRYRQKEQNAVVYPIGENKVKIIFDEPQRAVTPGQAAVIYDGDTVLGGGTIYDRNSLI